MTSWEYLYASVLQPFLCGLLWLISVTIHAAPVPPNWSIVVRTCSSAPNNININRCLTHNMSSGHRGISQNDEFSILNQFVPGSGSLAAVTFEGNDYVRQWYLSDRRNEWFMPESTVNIDTIQRMKISLQEFSSLQNNLYIFPSLSEPFLMSPHNQARDIIIIDFLLPEHGQVTELPPQSTPEMSVSVLQDRWRFEINLALLHAPLEICVPDALTLSLPDSGVRTNVSEKLTPLPMAILQESSKAITEDTEAVGGDVAIIVHYPLAEVGENQDPLYRTHMWVVPRSEDIQPPPEPSPSQLEFQPEDPLHTDKRRADKTKRKSQKADPTDAESINSLIQQVIDASRSVSEESAFYKVDYLMEMVLKLFASRSSLQASNTRSQAKKKLKHRQLKLADLVLSKSVHIVLDYFVKKPEAPFTTVRELSSEEVNYVPLSFAAKIYPQIQYLQYNTSEEHKDFIFKIDRFIGLILMGFAFEKMGIGGALAEPLTDIRDDLRTVVTFANRRELFIDTDTGPEIIYHLMLCAIEIPDVDMIFSLCNWNFRLCQSASTRQHGANYAQNCRIALRKTYLAAWTQLEGLLFRQDIPIPQLRQLITDARRIGLNTGLWSSRVDQYEQAKKGAIATMRESNAAEWERKVSIAEQHGRELLLQIDKEQAELAVLREQRDKKQKTARQKENRLVPRQQEIPDAAEPEEQTRDNPPEMEPEWQRLYWAGVEAYKKAGAEAALELFQKALDVQPDQLSRARIFSAMADCHFVPGEKVLKSLCESYNKALVFHRQMEQEAGQQQRPTLDKNALNALSYKFLEATKAILEPIKQSTRLHSDALESLSLVDIHSPGFDKAEAEGLLLILIKEWEQLSSMSARLREGNDALVKTYHLRKQIIENLIPTRATRISEEAITRKKLESVRKEMTSPGKKRVKGARGKQKDDISIQDNLSSSCKQVSEELEHFEEVASGARALLDSWKSPQPRFGEQSAIKLSEKDRQTIPELLASDARLGKKARKRLLTPNKLADYLSSFAFIMTRSEHSDRLDNFLRTLDLEEVDILGDHFCLFNAIMRWLQEHPDIAPDVNREMTGRQLFTMLAPKGVQLGQAFPQNAEMQGIATAFTEAGANYRAWGTDSMVHYLIAPWLNIPVLVLAAEDVYEGGVVAGVLYDSGNSDPVYEDQIANIMTNNTMVLIHRQNHWQVALPSTASRYNRESHTGNLSCTGYTEPFCQSFQSQ